MMRFRVFIFVFDLEGIDVKNKLSLKVKFKDSTQKDSLPIINLVIIYHQFNLKCLCPLPFVVQNTGPKTFFRVCVQKRQLRSTSKGLQHPWNTKIKNSTRKDLSSTTKYLIQYTVPFRPLVHGV
jgi:hypothetical protein